MKQAIIKYCIDFVKTDADAKKFMEYYAPDLKELYADHDMENFERKHELDYSFFNVIPDSYVEIIFNDLMEAFYNNHPY